MSMLQCKTILEHKWAIEWNVES